MLVKGATPGGPLDICTLPGLVMGPNWVIHYKVLLSSWRQLVSFSLWEGVRFWGIFFFCGNFLVVCGRLKSMLVVHFLSPFLYILAFLLFFSYSYLLSLIIGNTSLEYIVTLWFGWIFWWRLGYLLWHCIYGFWVWPTWSHFHFLLGALNGARKESNRKKGNRKESNSFG